MGNYYRLEASRFQRVYDQLRSVASRCDDDNRPVAQEAKQGNPLTLTTCDLGKLSAADRKKLTIEMTDKGGTKVFVNQDDLLQRLYSKLHRKDERDGKDDRKIATLPTTLPIIIPEGASISLTEQFQELYGPSVFEVTTTVIPTGGGARGTAFIIEKKSLGSGRYHYTFATNDHVADNKDQEEFSWILSHPNLRGRPPIYAKLVGIDPVADLALLETELDLDLPALQLGDSELLEPGDTLVAIGNTMGRGIFAAQGEVKEVHDGMEKYPYSLIRTEMGTAWGNSGGPVLNEDGEVIGIVSRGDPRVIGIINFEIPSSRVRRSIQNMRENANKQGGVLVGNWGFAFWPLKPEERIHFDPSLNHGVWISHVVPKSPAEKAGLRPGDLLLAVNGNTHVTQIDREIDSYRLRSVVLDSRKGEKFSLMILRGGVRQTVSLEADELIEKRLDVFHTPYPFAVREIGQDDRITNQLTKEGVTVLLDNPEGSLFQSLQHESIITNVGGQPTPTVGQFKVALEKAYGEAQRRGERRIRVDFYKPISRFGREYSGFALIPIH